MWWGAPAAGIGWLLGGENSVPRSPPRPVQALWQPGLYALGASTVAYVGLAAMEGLHNRCTNDSYARTLAKRRAAYDKRRGTPSRLFDHAGVSITVVGLNLAVFRYCQQNTSMYFKLADTHQRNWTRNWTLLTAAFCHLDPKHLTANLSSMLPEIPQILQVCGQSHYQFTAFYIAAAFCSSFAQRAVSYSQWSNSWLSRFDFTAPRGMGASGVTMAIFAASCFKQTWRSPAFWTSALTLSYQVADDIVGLYRGRKGIGFAVRCFKLVCSFQLTYSTRHI